MRLVSVSDLLVDVNILLERVPLSAWASLNDDTNLRVTVDELVAAINHLLHGCPG